MSDRREGGPINGKIGIALATIKQLTPLFGWVAFLFVTFGFKVSPPGKQFNEFAAQLQEANKRMEVIEDLVVSLVRLRCAELDKRDAALAGLNCESLR